MAPISTYTNVKSRKQTPQSEKADERQIPNSAGGFSFEVDPWKRLDRFLILGSEGGSYYASEKALTKENADAVVRLVKEDGLRVVSRIAEISAAGRAPKNTPAIFALALACSYNEKAAKAAFEAIPVVCRTGTHILQFVQVVKGMRGFGRGMARGISRWYSGKDAEALAYQLLKYQQREGWSHRDVLRLTRRHGMGELDPGQEAALRWAVAGFDGLGERTVTRKTKAGDKAASYGAVGELPKILQGYKEMLALDPKDVAGACRVITDYRLTHEMVPSHFQGERDVWAALLPHMPVGAMVRNLARMTANGLLQPMSSALSQVADALNADRIRKARLHPLSILSALVTYKSGHGVKGSLTWEPMAKILDVLDGAFYSAFRSVRVTGKRRVLALDVSGSMCGPNIAGVPGVSPRVGSAVMSLVTTAVEPNTVTVGFTGGGSYYGYGYGRRPGELELGKDGITVLPISKRQRLDDVVSTISDLPFGGTDCSLPMQWALKNGIEADSFEIYTDSETWAGGIHPHQALRDYRNKTGIPARLVVVGMVSNGFTIADPTDAGMLDVVGFSTDAPDLISGFVAGDI